MKRLLFSFLFLFLLLSIAFAQDIFKFGENIEIPVSEQVNRVINIGGNVRVEGAVKDGVFVFGGNIYLEDSAIVGGDVVAIGGKVEKSPGAIVKGKIREFKTLFYRPDFVFGLWQGRVPAYIAILALTLVLVSLFKKQYEVVLKYLQKRSAMSFVIGLIGILLIPFSIFAFILSIIGILFIPLWILVIVFVLVFGGISICEFLGRKLLFALNLHKFSSPVFDALIGVILFFLIGYLPILGFIFKFVALSFGVGATLATVFGTKGD